MKEKENIFGYPKEWEKYRLQDAVSFIDYGLSKAIPKVQPENGVKIVSTADITKSGKLTYDKIRRTEANERQIKNLTLVDGDVLFNWRNSPELIGKTTIFHEIDEPVIFASFILRISCDEKTTHNYFLKHLLNYFRYEGLFVQLSRRAVNQANYNRNEIYELPIFLPDYNEQLAIANVLTHIEEAIEKQQQLIDRTTELKKALMVKLFTEGTKGEPQKDSEIGLVPESWEIKKLGTITNLNYGKGLPKKQRKKGAIPVYGSNGQVGCHTIAFVKEPGIIVGRKGSAGKIHFSETPFCPIDTTYYITTNDCTVDLRYLSFLLQFINLERIVGDVGVPGLNREMAYLERVPITNSSTEQIEIVKIILSVESKLNNIIQRRIAFESLYKTILHELMTGKTRVKNVDLKRFKKEYNLPTNELDIAAEN